MFSDGSFAARHIMKHCGVKRHASSRYYLLKASVDFILVTPSRISDPVFPIIVPPTDTNPCVEIFGWEEEPTFGIDGVIADNEINVEWSDSNDKLSSDIDALVVFFSEKVVVAVDVYMPISILDSVISLTLRCKGKTRQGRICQNRRRPHGNRDFVYCHYLFLRSVHS